MARTVLLVGTLVPAAAIAEDSQPPRIEHEPCASYEKGKAFKIQARIFDASPIFDPKVHYKSESGSKWKSAPLSRSPSSADFEATLRPAELRGTILYFLEAFDENGNGPAQLGSPEEPIRLTPSNEPVSCVQVGEPTTAAASGGETITATALERPVVSAQQSGPAASGCDLQPSPWYCSGATWGAILGGVLVVGGMVGLVYWLRSSNEPASTRGRDEMSISVTGAGPVSGIMLRTSWP